MLHTTPLPPPSVEDLERALREVLDTLMRDRRRREKQRAGTELAPLVVISASALMNTDSAVMEQRGWCANPVDRALKHALHEIGQHLATRLGSTEALLKVAGRLAGRGREYDRRINVLDKAFDGICVGEHDIWAA